MSEPNCVPPSQPRSESADSFPIVNEVMSDSMQQLVAGVRDISQSQQSWSVSDWPTRQLNAIAAAGVYRWFIPLEQGGLGWSDADLARGLCELGSACLTSTFIVTQRVAALKRIASSDNALARERLLAGLIDGTASATVGISHLTTSRQHVRKPVMQVRRDGDTWIAEGMAPWVTGASNAAHLLLGGTLADGREILFTVATNALGVVVEPGLELVALSSSHTGIVRCKNVLVEDAQVIAGPRESVLSSGSGGGAGSIQTSALALGLAKSAIDFIGRESEKRMDLAETAGALRGQHESLLEEAVAIASGERPHTGKLRTDVNSLVMRSTQSAMIAAKGAGFVEGHPVGRWCREALFFLVWSCPQPVAEANLCELVSLPS